jgi:hypothetical protein
MKIVIIFICMDILFRHIMNYTNVAIIERGKFNLKLPKIIFIIREKLSYQSYG